MTLIDATQEMMDLLKIYDNNIEESEDDTSTALKCLVVEMKNFIEHYDYYMGLVKKRKDLVKKISAPHSCDECGGEDE